MMPSSRIAHQIRLQDDTCLLAIACVTTPSIKLLTDAVNRLTREHALDPFSGSRKTKLSSKGLHFTDVSEDLRTDYTKLLAFAPFRAYVAFGALTPRDDYEAKYLELLGALLPRRLMASDREAVDLVAEQNSRIGFSRLQELVTTVYKRLEANDNRRPIAPPNVVFGTKFTVTALAVPDFLLGVFNRYFGDARPATLTDLNRFERLRDKYRHIVNIDTRQVFSRRHPLKQQ